MNRASIRKILEDSVYDLFNEQPNIFEFASGTTQTEWNLGHHLAEYIHKYFPWYDYDLDLTKTNYSNKRPDIVFHKRGTHEHNFLVVELKKDGNNTFINNDLKKVRDEWMTGQLNYQFGAVINVHSDGKCEVVVLENGQSKTVNS